MNHDEPNLERLLDEQLKHLPAPRAPRTLMPRVLAELRRRAALPWYQRAWFTWPRHWQVVSVMLVIGMLAGVAMLLPEVHPGRALGNLTARLQDATEGFGTGLNTAALLWRALVQPALLYVLAFLAVMVAACAAFGATLARVLGRELKFA